jgi:hypothetical protein
VTTPQEVPELGTSDMAEPDPFTTCMDRLDELNSEGGCIVTTEPPATELDQRVAELEMRLQVQAAMLYSMGRGLSSVLDVLGLDHRAACAELVGEEALPE